MARSLSERPGSVDQYLQQDGNSRLADLVLLHALDMYRVYNSFSLPCYRVRRWLRWRELNLHFA